MTQEPQPQGTITRHPAAAPRDDYEANATPLERDPQAEAAAAANVQRTLDRAQGVQSAEAKALAETAAREQAERRNPVPRAPIAMHYPTIGRIVRFYSIREGECGPVATPDDGVPAMVTAVQPNGRPNLTVFGDGIAPHPYTNVPHFLEREADGATVRWWVWPEEADQIAHGQRQARKEAEAASGRLFLRPRRDV